MVIVFSALATHILNRLELRAVDGEEDVGIVLFHFIVNRSK